MTNPVYIECPTCGAKYNSDTATYLLASGSEASSNKVFTRVCQYVTNPQKAQGCINKHGSLDESQGWLGLQNITAEPRY